MLLASPNNWRAWSHRTPDLHKKYNKGPWIPQSLSWNPVWKGSPSSLNLHEWFSWGGIKLPGNGFLQEDLRPRKRKKGNIWHPVSFPALWAWSKSYRRLVWTHVRLEQAGRCTHGAVLDLQFAALTAVLIHLFFIDSLICWVSTANKTEPLTSLRWHSIRRDKQ